LKGLSLQRLDRHNWQELGVCCKISVSDSDGRKY